MRTGKGAQVFFLEPTDVEPKFLANAPDIYILQHSKSPYGVIGRARLNKWLNDWDFADRADILGRLQSNSNQHHQGAVWELFINSFFRHLGFQVKRDPKKHSGKTPDYKLSKFFSHIYLEASINSDEPATPAEKHWITLVSEIEKIERDDFSISLQSVKATSIVPKISSFAQAINKFLDSLDYDSFDDSDIWNIPKESISIGEWEISVTPLKKKIRNLDSSFITMRGNANSPLITDLQDLRTKIEKKRKRYGKLDAPFIIAILENSLILKDDRWHRFGALFGQEAVRFSTNGSAESVRMNDGVWDINKGETSIEGLLLQSRLNITFPSLDLPELWINPRIIKSKLQRIVPLTHLILEGENYEVKMGLATWDGLSSPSISSKIARILTAVLHWGR